MQQLAALRADRARRASEDDDDEAELLPVRVRLKPDDTFRGRTQRHFLALAEQLGVAVEVDAVERSIDVEAAARRFVGWMREMGFTGVHTDKVMRDYVEWWRSDENVAALPDRTLMQAVARLPHVRRERVRLAARGEGQGRVTRYWIYDSVVAAAPSRERSMQMQLRLAA